MQHSEDDACEASCVVNLVNMLQLHVTSTWSNCLQEEQEDNDDDDGLSTEQQLWLILAFGFSSLAFFAYALQVERSAS